MHTADQRRAAAAYKRVEATRSAEQGPRRIYCSLCLKVGAMIRNNGLCQAVAFLEAGEVRRPFLEHFAQVVLAEDSPTAELEPALDPEPRPQGSGRPSPRNASPAKSGCAATLADRARTAGLTDYQHLTREALQCAVWFQRYAQSVLKADPADTIQGD